MGDVKDFKKGAVVVPLLDPKRHEVKLVDQNRVSATCNVMHPQGVDRFEEFIIAGYNQGVMTTIAFMDLPDMYIAIEKLKLLFTEAMDQLPVAHRMEILATIAERQGK